MVFTPFSKIFQSYLRNSSDNSCLSWVSPVLGWGSEVSCPRTLPQKNPENPVWLEPRTPGLRVKHFTTEPPKTPARFLKNPVNLAVLRGKIRKIKLLLIPLEP